jgi:hypothetical protein
MSYPDYMEPATAGRYLDPDKPIPPTTMQWWRTTGRGPRFFKIGKRITYARADLDLFRSGCAVEPEAA